MISRLKEGKVVDTIKFNQQKDYGEKESDDQLVKKQEFQKIKIFGLQQQEIQVYQYHNYYTTQFLSKTVGINLIKQFISAYFGIIEDNIINYKESEFDPINQQNIEITFEISEEPQLLTMVERQQKLGDYKQISEQIKSYAPIYKVFNLKTKAITYYFKNILNENQYIDIFNQLHTGLYYIQSNRFYLTCIKYNNNYKGKVFYPIKYYHDLPILEDNNLLIQIIDYNQLTTYIFKQDKMIVQLQLITSEIPNPFKFKFGQLEKKIQSYQVQLNFINQTQKQITKKMDLLNFMPQWRKTHGNQFLIDGIKHNSKYNPKIKITFFPSTSYVQIQCETDDLDTANFNFTMLANYFQLEDPFQDLYQSTGVKKDKVKTYLQYKNNTGNTKNEDFDLKEIGTSQFNSKQQFSKIQDSQLDDLQLVDPISYGIDDRYEYQKLVTDVLKRPIQIDFNFEEIDVFKKVKGGKVQDKFQLKGCAKGSPVYVNHDYDYSKFLLFQHDLLINGFVLRNQTYVGIFNKYKCSQSYPYLLLGNTKGKDSISCVIDPMNKDGLSVFEYYDVACRLLNEEKGYKKYLRSLLYGRVSVSATKFSQWITPGRCSEIPLSLKKILGSNVLLLSSLHQHDEFASDTQYQINPVLDFEWLESVFGQSFDKIYDGSVIYDYQDGQYYSTNSEGKKLSFWVKFPNHKRYLVIYDDIITQNIDNKKLHYYKPYFNNFKLTKQKRQFDQDYYKQFGILGYIPFKHSTNYLITKKGTFPFVDSTQGLKIIKQQITDSLPSYETIKKLIDDTDNYIINYKGKKIGTKYNGLLFYWKEIDFETKQKLTIGTYLMNLDFQTNDIQKGSSYDFQKIAYCIYQYIQLHKSIKSEFILKGETEVEMAKDALDENKIIEIVKYLDRYSETSQEQYYFNKFIPLFYTLNKNQINQGLIELKQLLPQSDQLMYDYIKGLAKFSNNKDLQYNPNEKEELLKLFIKKDYDFE